jgi:repressor LexA
MVPVSQRIARPGAVYFLLHAVGDSMDEAGINDGDLVLVRQQPVADEGQKIVALIDDEATIKEFRRKKEKVVLAPRSSNPRHRPIILDQEFIIQGVVIDTLPNPLE